MTDKNYFKFTRRRAIAGLGMIGAGAAAGAGGTAAYFSDSVDSNNNQINAGNIDLKTDGNNSETATFNIGPIAPGDSGTATLPTANTGTTDGFVSLEFDTPDSRNDLTEVLLITVRYRGNTIRQGTFDTVFDGEGEWSTADIPLGANTGGKDLAIDWELPTGAGNDVQGQTAKADFTINLNQEKAAFADVIVDSSTSGPTTVQEGVDAAPVAGGDSVVLVTDGTYNEAVTVDKQVTIAGQTSPANPTRPTINASAQDDNKAIKIDGIDGVTVSGLQITFNGDDSSNSEKYAIRARAASNKLTVRDCVIGDFSTKDNASNDGAVRSTGVTITTTQGPQSGSPVNRPIIENNTFQNIRNASDVDPSNSDEDSKAKGLALNGDITNAAAVRNVFDGIGSASNSSDPSGAQDALTTNGATGSAKPRGISIVNAGASTGPKGFTILENTFDNIVGTYGQPAIFLGGSGGLADHEVYNNRFYHPVDNLRGGGGLRLRQNAWFDTSGNQHYPSLVASDQDNDGGNLVDRSGGSNYTTNPQHP